MDEEGLLGDVVICPAVASAQNRDLDAELRLLLVHGILHLLGYDHDEEDERRAMWDRQERYAGVRP
jgi:probable rRNA maturation factor